MGGFLAFIAAIYIAYKIISEEWGMGDQYRSVGDLQKDSRSKDAYYKKASESEGAVGCSVVFLIIVVIFVIIALLGN